MDECLSANLTQEQRNKLGEKIFNILLIQLFDLGFMQTDPNPANFFYEAEKDVLNLIDFGAGNKIFKMVLISNSSIFHSEFCGQLYEDYLWNLN